ncbi:MAG: PAS domain-containing protein [Elusimicrobia bacterium]|nr:PAS domain-containing protein [Candidatus Liberimonas magnetica]
MQKNSIKNSLEQKTEKKQKEKYVLKLFVSGLTPKSQKAIANIKKLCRECLEGRHDLEIIDIYQNPKLAKDWHIIAAPTLIKEFPEPSRRFIGDMSNIEKLLVGLGLAPKEKNKTLGNESRKEITAGTLKENEKLSLRLSEVEETLNAIRKGNVDALVVTGHKGEKVFTFKGADYAYRILVETMNEGAATLTSDGTVMYCNKRLSQMLGVPIKRITGNSIKEFIQPQDLAKYNSIIAQGLLGSSSGEVTVRRKDETILSMHISCSPLKIDNAGVCIVFTDITLIKQKELMINTQREELLHVTRVGKLAEFVSSLAHEISQPLTSILSYAQAAKRMLAGKATELEKILSYIIDDDQRASEVIQRLRSLLKKGRPEIKPLDVNTLINETMILSSTDAIVRNTLIKLQLESGLPLVQGDRIQLQQVLLNLISNSFDAMEDNKGPREIAIRTSQKVLKGTDAIMVAVKDSGSGITAQNMPKLFTHFFTSKPDGLGMGLSISRSIIEAHGGRLYAENNPERGVTFYFTIPVKTKDSR